MDLISTPGIIFTSIVTPGTTTLCVGYGAGAGGKIDICERARPFRAVRANAFPKKTR